LAEERAKEEERDKSATVLRRQQEEIERLEEEIKMLRGANEVN
jgi:hypothetical protein